MNEKKIPSAVSEALEKVEVYFDGVIPWLANMYDPETKGFYMTVSGKEDPEMEPAIEMTCWGLSYLYRYTNALKSAPAEFTQGIIDFANDRQDPETGLYIDKQGPVNPRETARNQDAGLRIFEMLGGSPKYPHPRHAKASTSSSVIMPDFMASPESYVEWVADHNWDHGSWTAGDQVESSLQFLKMLEPATRERYEEALFKWLDARQQESGLWSPDFDFNAVSGVYKVGSTYSRCGRRIPNHSKVIDAIFHCYRVSKTSSPFFVRNPISVLKVMMDYDEQTAEKVRRLIIENIDAVTASFGEFLCPDGAFSAKKERSMLAFGGVVGSHELFEGDIDATFMMLIARKMLYEIFDIDAPKLATDDFWDWIYGKKPLPKLGKA